MSTRTRIRVIFILCSLFTSNESLQLEITVSNYPPFSVNCLQSYPCATTPDKPSLKVTGMELHPSNKNSCSANIINHVTTELEIFTNYFCRTNGTTDLRSKSLYNSTQDYGCSVNIIVTRIVINCECTSELLPGLESSSKTSSLTSARFSSVTTYDATSSSTNNRGTSSAMNTGSSCEPSYSEGRDRVEDTDVGRVVAATVCSVVVCGAVILALALLCKRKIFCFKGAFYSVGRSDRTEQASAEARGTSAELVAEYYNEIPLQRHQSGLRAAKTIEDQRSAPQDLKLSDDPQLNDYATTVSNQESLYSTRSEQIYSSLQMNTYHNMPSSP